MKMMPRIVHLNEKKLVGMRLTMSFVEDKIGELWKKFMPRKWEIKETLTHDLISMAVYKSTHFDDFHPANEFEKWAALEVANFKYIPDGMESFVISGGMYAVFNYQGPNTDSSIFQYIFGAWIPASEYNLDHRPHFEILGEKYKNHDPKSEEDIYIPIKHKIHQKPEIGF